MKRIPILTDWFKSIHRNFFCEDIQIADGNEGEGKVLTSDADGQGTWQEPTGSMPAPINKNTLAADANGWKSTDAIQIDTTVDYSAKHRIDIRSEYICIGRYDGSTSGRFWLTVSNDGVRAGIAAGSYRLQMVPDGDNAAKLYIACTNFAVTNLEFRCGLLAGTGSALLQTDSLGNITRNTGPVMQRKTRLVTSAELLALHNTPLILIGGQAGKVIRLHRVGYVYTHGMAYGSSGSGFINVAYDGASDSFWPMFTVIAQSSSQFQDTPYVTPANPGFPLSELLGKGILMVIPDGFALLTGTGTIKVIIDYEIIDV